MMIVDKELKKLMRKNKADLQKLMRETTQKANRRLNIFYKNDKYERLPIQTRNLLDTWTIENKVSKSKNRNRRYFNTKPEKDRKKDLAMRILQARVFMNIPEPKETDEKVSESLRKMSDNFKMFYAESDFWDIYWSQFSDAMTRQEFWSYADKIAAECERQEEFYTRLQGGNWI